MPTPYRFIYAFAAVLLFAAPASATDMVGSTPDPNQVVKCFDGYVLDDSGKCVYNVETDSALIGSTSDIAAECPTGTLTGESGECSAANNRMPCPAGFAKGGIGDTCVGILENKAQ